MNRRDALIRVIDSLHAEIAALQANDIAALETATAMKLQGIEAVAANDDLPLDAELEVLAREAQRLNETARIYVNLMAANVRRRIDQLAGGGGLPAYRPGLAATPQRMAVAAYR
jgi:hypothetical protein